MCISPALEAFTLSQNTTKALGAVRKPGALALALLEQVTVV